jgi:two-component system, response regulator PdtaR
MARGRKILIVEDDPFIGMANEAILAGAGYEVVGLATTAEEAVALAAQKEPDLVLIDVQLAKASDGIKAAAAIHQKLGIRSLFATANVDPGTKARAAIARPLGWVPKPYDGERLVRAIADALRTLNNGEAPHGA